MALVTPQSVQKELYEALDQLNKILASLNSRLDKIEEAKETPKVKGAKNAA
jgi:uncharacterized protein YukE